MGRHNTLPPVVLVTKLSAAVAPAFEALNFICFPPTSPTRTHTLIRLTRHFTEMFCLFLPSVFCCQWSVATVWKVTPWIYILDWLYATSNAWPRVRFMAILASSLPWLHFNIFILFTIYRSIWLNWAQTYRVKHHQFCSWSFISPQLMPTSLPITVKQTQNQTQSLGRLSW